MFCEVHMLLNPSKTDLNVLSLPLAMSCYRMNVAPCSKLSSLFMMKTALGNYLSSLLLFRTVWSCMK